MRGRDGPCLPAGATGPAFQQARRALPSSRRDWPCIPAGAPQDAQEAHWQRRSRVWRLRGDVKVSLFHNIESISGPRQGSEAWYQDSESRIWRLRGNDRFPLLIEFKPISGPQQDSKVLLPHNIESTSGPRQKPEAWHWDLEARVWRLRGDRGLSFVLISSLDQDLVVFDRRFVEELGELSPL